MTETQEIDETPRCEVCADPAVRVLVVLIREPAAHLVEGPVCEVCWGQARAVAESWGDALASRPL